MGARKMSIENLKPKKDKKTMSKEKKHKNMRFFHCQQLGHIAIYCPKTDLEHEYLKQYYKNLTKTCQEGSGDIGESSNQRECMDDNINMFDWVERGHEDAYFKKGKWAMGTYLENQKESSHQTDKEFRQQIWDYVIQKKENPQEELNLVTDSRYIKSCTGKIWKLIAIKLGFDWCIEDELRLIYVYYLDLLEWFYKTMRDKINLNDNEE
ncbi:hypothetical protein L1987_14349 [Smallanthus sonchifolius]|uniref:Uncharacterized protein n=1 Tax=Smallanthus sonchifolius TaxID=185202 RepID=A0ACB9J4K6_9ASTR|nr:hypothetical protein L1987_14349 [Smallanthus sonchifolius]